MATPLTADRLLKALRDEGLTVVEHRNWRTNNRNHKGAWGPAHGVMIHHTVTTGTASSVELCYNGHSALPGPLCHGVIAKDGTVHLVGNGRANHAGSGDGAVLQAVIAERALPPDTKANTDGNRHFYGFEAVNLGDGKDPWPAAQLLAIERAAAAVCRAEGIETAEQLAFLRRHRCDVGQGYL
ncbi:N-acetylmuramoyl-L-alanine amidase, partial [Streptomyces sp. NPDC007346]|uniref:peptidoglycan recognition protein family protein n=1 Tax=Streptomyces sp. NPDC007346 TaxID=3154682 RepID=UPI0034556B56